MNKEICFFLESVKAGLKALSDKYQDELTIQQIAALVVLALKSVETKNEFIELNLKGDN